MGFLCPPPPAAVFVSIRIRRFVRTTLAAGAPRGLRFYDVSECVVIIYYYRLQRKTELDILASPSSLKVENDRGTRNLQFRKKKKVSTPVAVFGKRDGDGAILIFF